MSGFLLAHRGAGNCETVRSNVFDLEADHVTASKLAIDSEIEHGKVACSPFNLQLGPDRPDVLGTQGRLRADQLALIPWDLDRRRLVGSFLQTFHGHTPLRETANHAIPKSHPHWSALGQRTFPMQK
jgi:hypothetical protein